ncbi:MAG TPA: 30S ribosomal protein S2, partial [Nakamurella sp.]|nr:30S ribosomal protein S2 [Nakamurella sp.]
RDMARVPSAIWVVDTKKEHIAVGEARKLGIPVVAVLDTNCDPDEVDYPLPGNDDAIRSAALLTKVVAEAVAEGLLARSGGAAVAAGEEPLAEWERELLAAHEASQAAENGTAPQDADTAAPTAAPTAGAAQPADAGLPAEAQPADAALPAEVSPDAVAETESAARGLAELAGDAAAGIDEVVANEQTGGTTDSDVAAER